MARKEHRKTTGTRSGAGNGNWRCARDAVYAEQWHSARPAVYRLGC